MSIDEFNKILNEGPTYTKTKKHHDNPEHRLQVSCVRWFRYNYKDILIWANPSGGQRDKATGANLKKEGAIAGVPDLTIATARKGYHGLYIEMKNGTKNNTTAEQKTVIERLNRENYLAVVCRTFDDFCKVIHEYLD